MGYNAILYCAFFEKKVLALKSGQPLPGLTHTGFLSFIKTDRHIGYVFTGTGTMVTSFPRRNTVKEATAELTDTEAMSPPLELTTS